MPWNSFKCFLIGFIQSLVIEEQIYQEGQRQRVTIARALLRKPALLILDEATSSLDIKSENLIYNSLEKLHEKLTVILVSHKLKTLKYADTIYVLHNGEIVQKGNFNSLIKNENEKFYNMINNQL